MQSPRRLEDQIEPGLPRLSAVYRSDGRFANAVSLRRPRAAHQPVFAICGLVGAAQHNLPVLHPAFDGQQLSAARHPALMPNTARMVINTEALAFDAIGAIVSLLQHAAAQNLLDA